MISFYAINVKIVKPKNLLLIKYLINFFQVTIRFISIPNVSIHIYGLFYSMLFRLFYQLYLRYEKILYKHNYHNILQR